MRILVCGGRNFNDYPFVRDTLNGLMPPATDDMNTWLPPPDTVIIHGDAPGADRCAEQWVHVNWAGVERYPADWKAHGRAAGPIRNQRMLDEGKPDLVVAFLGGNGTADMVRRAKMAGVRVIEPRKESSL
jgi:hypothetical protein